MRSGSRRDARSSGGRPKRPAPVATLTIDSIGAGGEGVGRLADGRVSFVHGTAPGDVVEVRLIEERSRWTRGKLLSVVTPSGLRREPPCSFAGRCGGCTLEHLAYSAQLEAKRRIIEDALQRIGGITAEVSAVVPSPREHRYRNRVTFAVWRRGAGEVLAGFHALGEPARLVDVDGSCMLPEPPISAVWDGIRAAWGPNARMLPSGERLRLTLRATSAGAVSMLIEGGYSAGRLDELFDQVEGLSSIWHRPGSEPAALVAGSPGLPETWGEETLELSGAAFLQVNRDAAALLEAYVLEIAGEVAGLRVVDAYCGIGFHSRRFARAGAEVVGIELDPQAVESASADAPSGVRFLAGPVEALLTAELPADLVLLNPPRAGVAPEVTDALRASPPGRIIYISCDPATLSRDLGRLGNGYRLRRLQAFDLFPQTAHVETVAELVRSPNDSSSV